MIYFFYGDAIKAGDKAKALSDSLLKKKPDASLFVINDENCNAETFQEMVQSTALFENKYIVRVKQVLQTSGARRQTPIIFDFLKEMKDSENIFIWNEEKVLKTELKKIEKVAEKVVETARSEKREARSNKVFSICDPIISRDKQKAWIIYQDLIKDYPIPELHGIIFMQFKNIAISFKANQKDSGLAPFPYNQAKRAQTKYEEKEVLEKVNELANIVHESRSGGVELEIALEKFILNI